MAYKTMVPNGTNILNNESIYWSPDMNIELDDVVVLNVSDDELELAAGGAQAGPSHNYTCTGCH